jgi:hypothetical protein
MLPLPRPLRQFDHFGALVCIEIAAYPGNRPSNGAIVAGTFLSEIVDHDTTAIVKSVSERFVVAAAVRRIVDGRNTRGLSIHLAIDDSIVATDDILFCIPEYSGRVTPTVSAPIVACQENSVPPQRGCEQQRIYQVGGVSSA